jgi:hydrogenase-1 operon protein HyaF
MSGLDSIHIAVEHTHPKALAEAENALPVLHEIRHALSQLLETAESTIIDLSAIPFGPGDKERLLETLGRGEVSATVDSLGLTQIYETAYPGVWIIEYLSPQDTTLALHIEITTLPSLLATPREDISDSLLQLENRLLRSHTSYPEEEQESSWRTTSP